MNNPEQKKVTTPQAKAQEKLTDEQLERLNAGDLGAAIDHGVWNVTTLGKDAGVVFGDEPDAAFELLCAQQKAKRLNG